MPVARMTILEHLGELRRAILVSVGVWLGMSALAWTRAKEMLGWLLEPLGQPTVFLGPAEGFMLTFKVALLAGAAAASPVILWQGLWFLLPALKRKEKKLIWIIAASGTLAFMAGAVFAYRLLLPAMVSFFMGFATETFRAQIVGARYVSFVLYLVAACGFAFEFPIVTGTLSSLGFLSHRTLLKQWRIAILGCFTAAALITPSPDAFTMIMVALPLVGLFLAGVGSAALFRKRGGR